MLAHVALANSKHPTDLRPVHEQRHLVKDAYSQEVKLSFDSYGLWTVDSKGELDLSFGMEIAPIRRFYEDAGKGHFYQMIRLGLAIKLFELMVPLEILKKVPGAGIVASVRDIVAKMVPKLSPIRDLFTPRFRVLEDQNAVLQAMEEELERADQETARRNLRKHEVINHIRRLPQGHHPSPQARHLAMEELGVELAENETYVRKHVRGKDENGEITSHHQRERRALWRDR
jgi:hypothetical protein